ncbi:MAG: hypothetical protein U0V74_00505 [Chitinophagales bacterium]
MIKTTTLLAAVLCTAAVYGQSIFVEEAPRAMSKGAQPSFLVDIPGSKSKTVEKDWTKYLEKGSKSKAENLNGEMTIKGITVKNISTLPLAVYSTLLETNEGVRLTVWVAEQDSVFISEKLSNDKNLAAIKYVKDFANAEYREVVKDELQAEKNKLDKLQDELKKLISVEEKAKGAIKENERSIERNKNDIKINEADQKRKIEQVTAQKAVVETTKAGGGDAYKEAQKALDNLMGEKEKLEKENEKLNKQIDKWEKENREEDRAINQSKQDQGQKNEQIGKQKAVVEAVESKLAAIK